MKNYSAWQTQLANAVTDPRELLTLLELDLNLIDEVTAASKQFSLRVPREFIARMKKGDIHDPLLRQVLPINDELNLVSGYEFDPLQEQNKNPLSGLLHKFHGRILLIVTGACGVNCRFCFRRNFPYENNNPGSTGWQDVLAYIEKDPTLTEVILSGGDPLIANDQTLSKLVTQLEKIPHLKRLRIHTRMPIVLPSRISAEFLAWISQTRLKTSIVMHCNHPHEINESVTQAMLQLSQANVILLNQSVLLKDVNDNADVLIELSEKLFACGILPYYLHVLDKVHGAAHFDISLDKAKQLHADIKHRLPGYLVPKLAKEQAGAEAKIIL